MSSAGVRTVLSLLAAGPARSGRCWRPCWPWSWSAPRCWAPAPFSSPAPRSGRWRSPRPAPRPTTSASPPTPCTVRGPDAPSVADDTRAVLTSALAPFPATTTARASSVMRSLPPTRAGGTGVPAEAYLSGVEDLPARALLITGRWPRAAAPARRWRRSCSSPPRGARPHPRQPRPPRRRELASDPPRPWT